MCSSLRDKPVAELTELLFANVRQLPIPLVLASRDDHSQHLGHGVLHSLNASVVVWRWELVAS